MGLLKFDKREIIVIGDIEYGDTAKYKVNFMRRIFSRYEKICSSSSNVGQKDVKAYWYPI